MKVTAGQRPTEELENMTSGLLQEKPELIKQQQHMPIFSPVANEEIIQTSEMGNIESQNESMRFQSKNIISFFNLPVILPQASPTVQLPTTLQANQSSQIQQNSISDLGDSFAFQPEQHSSSQQLKLRKMPQLKLELSQLHSYNANTSMSNYNNNASISSPQQQQQFASPMPPLSAKVDSRTNSAVYYHRRALSIEQNHTKHSHFLVAKSPVGSSKHDIFSNHNINATDEQLMKNRLQEQQQKRTSTNHFSFFKKTNLVNRFIRNLLSHSRLHIFKQLSKFQFDTINDAASHYEYFQSAGLIKKQDSRFSIIWECLTMLFWVLIIFYTPFRINFSFDTKQELDYSELRLYEIFVMCLLIVETFIMLNKAIFKRGMIIVNRDQILQSYLKQDSLLDSFIFVTFLFSNIISGWNFLEYVLEFRLLRVIKTVREIFSRLDLHTRHAVYERITILVLTVLCFINLQASIFVKLNIIESHLPQGISSGESSLDLYVAGLYWSTITMTTIGYGDIYPQSTFERIYVSIVSLISCGIFGYSISSIGEIVADTQRRSEVFNSKMLALNRLMNSHSMSKNLKYQVINYHEYLHKEDSWEIEEAGRTMIEMLPHSMRETVTREMNAKMFTSQKIFTLNFTEQFLQALSMKTKQMRIGPEIDLFAEGDLDSRLYFIHRGSIVLSFKQNHVVKQCATLEEGDMVGEIEFFSQSARKFGAKSASVVTLYFIDFSDFYSTLADFPSDFETYNIMKDKIWQIGDLKPLDRKCESCGSFNHLFFHCNRLQYTVNIDKLIHVNNSSQNQLTRDSSYHRSRTRSNSAWVKFEQNALPIVEYFIHNAAAIQQQQLNQQQNNIVQLQQLLSQNPFALSQIQQHQLQLQLLQQQQQYQQFQTNYISIDSSRDSPDLHQSSLVRQFFKSEEDPIQPPPISSLYMSPNGNSALQQQKQYLQFLQQQQIMFQQSQQQQLLMKYRSLYGDKDHYSGIVPPIPNALSPREQRKRSVILRTKQSFQFPKMDISMPIQFQQQQLPPSHQNQEGFQPLDKIMQMSNFVHDPILEQLQQQPQQQQQMQQQIQQSAFQQQFSSQFHPNPMKRSNLKSGTMVSVISSPRNHMNQSIFSGGNLINNSSVHSNPNNNNNNPTANNNNNNNNNNTNSFPSLAQQQHVQEQLQPQQHSMSNITSSHNNNAINNNSMNNNNNNSGSNNNNSNNNSTWMQQQNVRQRIRSKSGSDIKAVQIRSISSSDPDVIQPGFFDSSFAPAETMYQQQQTMNSTANNYPFQVLNQNRRNTMIAQTQDNNNLIDGGGLFNCETQPDTYGQQIGMAVSSPNIFSKQQSGQSTQLASLWLSGLFEIARNYIFYYPQHNIDKVLLKVNAKAISLLKVRKQKIRSFKSSQRIETPLFKATRKSKQIFEFPIPQPSSSALLQHVSQNPIPQQQQSVDLKVV